MGCSFFELCKKPTFNLANKRTECYIREEHDGKPRICGEAETPKRGLVPSLMESRHSNGSDKGFFKH